MGWSGTVSVERKRFKNISLQDLVRIIYYILSRIKIWPFEFSSRLRIDSYRGIAI